MALVAVAISAAMLPGLAAAAGNSVNAKNCQTDYAALARGHGKVPTDGHQEVPTPRPILTTG
jgi:hypothetical protein